MKSDSLQLLYSRSSTGAILQWQIEVLGNQYRVISGQLSGKLITAAWTTCAGKSIGKKNETTPEAQALLEAEAKWEKKAKTGYSPDINSIDTCLTYVKPMLAKNFKDRLNKIDWKLGVLVENKFNGNRAIATLENGEVVLKTRKGEVWVSVPHINADLVEFFSEHPLAVLDGELFAESLVSNLNELSTIVRREKNITAEDVRRSEELVRFWIYDGYGFTNMLGEEVAYELRKEWIDVNMPKFSKYYCYVEATECRSFAEVDAVYKRYLAAEQEGAIIRIKGTPYEHDRSAWLLKWKPQMDSEGVILSLHEGTGNWAGMIKTATIRWENKEFDATFKGSKKLGIERLNHPEAWIGKTVTFLFNDLTGLGVPNFARIDPLNCWKNDR